MVKVLRFAIAFLAVFSASAADQYLFTSFRSNGETGIFLALSSDGRKWTTLNNEKPWLKPSETGMLMRDPWIGRGPDGVYHMIWTWAWNRDHQAGSRLRIGHASSTDLVNWSAQQAIYLLDKEPTARNVWAPEAVWDPKRKLWIIYWATTIPGRFNAGEQSGDNGYNHRIYATETSDWSHFTDAHLFFDPGFSCIDSTIVQNGKRWIMVFKDERKTPLMKRLRLAFSDSPGGPWTNVSEPFTEDWVEGPTVMRMGSEWWIYFDLYASPQHYGGVRTSDWKKFDDVTADVTFPVGQRHGTVLKISGTTADLLRRQSR
jgi:hypothetical protein